jgi:hypothetical protein
MKPQACFNGTSEFGEDLLDPVGILNAVRDMDPKNADLIHGINR